MSAAAAVASAGSGTGSGSGSGGGGGVESCVTFSANSAPEWTAALAAVGVCPRCVLRFLNVRMFTFYQLSTQVLTAKFALSNPNLKWSTGTYRFVVGSLSGRADAMLMAQCVVVAGGGGGGGGVRTCRAVYCVFGYITNRRISHRDDYE